MKMCLAISAAMIGLLTLVGCNHFDIRTMPRSGRYMVVTRFGDKFIFDKVGVTIFNDHTLLYPDGQDLGNVFRDGIVTALSQDSAWTYVPVNLTLPKPVYKVSDRAAAANLYLERVSKLDEPTSADMAAIKKVAADNHIDMVIFVAESTYPDILVQNSNQHLTGHGVFKRSSANVEDHAYVAYHLMMFDTSSWGGTDYISLSLRNMAEFDWPDSGQPIPDDVLKAGSEALSQIVPPTDLPFALCYIGLTRYTSSSDRHTRAYACAQHYGLDSLRGTHNMLIQSWLTEPQTPGHEDRLP